MFPLFNPSLVNPEDASHLSLPRDQARIEYLRQRRGQPGTWITDLILRRNITFDYLLSTRVPSTPCACCVAADRPCTFLQWAVPCFRCLLFKDHNCEFTSLDAWDAYWGKERRELDIHPQIHPLALEEFDRLYQDSRRRFQHFHFLDNDSEDIRGLHLHYFGATRSNPLELIELLGDAMAVPSSPRLIDSARHLVYASVLQRRVSFDIGSGSDSDDGSSDGASSDDADNMARFDARDWFGWDEEDTEFNL
ncbi:hypothetical protein FB45DRAFT_1026110 [Roridomyces roridus]|uniref:Uncharacterized protein n=1 Tax=Roridomyces roridus TaxID=1738132 RepID=A0AAD7C033_9AGAR|nr:hypothetical protein FB45DRAFT_1026110 [Roridomyces roridus]